LRTKLYKIVVEPHKKRRMCDRYIRQDFTPAACIWWWC